MNEPLLTDKQIQDLAYNIVGEDRVSIATIQRVQYALTAVRNTYEARIALYEDRIEALEARILELQEER